MFVCAYMVYSLCFALKLISPLSWSLHGKLLASASGTRKHPSGEHICEYQRLKLPPVSNTDQMRVRLFEWIHRVSCCYWSIAAANAISAGAVMSSPPLRSDLGICAPQWTDVQRSSGTLWIIRLLKRHCLPCVCQLTELHSLSTPNSINYLPPRFINTQQDPSSFESSFNNVFGAQTGICVNNDESSWNK